MSDAAISNVLKKPARKRKASQKSTMKIHKEDTFEPKEKELVCALFGGKSDGTETSRIAQKSSDIQYGLKDSSQAKKVVHCDKFGVALSIDGDSKSEQATPWMDPDDCMVDALGPSGQRLKKLRDSQQEVSKWNSGELDNRLRKRYENTALRSARTDWATVDIEGRKDTGESAQSKVLSSSMSMLASSRTQLTANVLNIVRQKDANESDPSSAVLRCVRFHPGSSADEPLLMTAGLDKTIRFFSVGAENSKKVHGVHFPRMPIHTASFLSDSGKVVVSGRRSFFYFYDLVAGKVDLVPGINGRDEKSWENHFASPDGKLIAFIGNDGYIVLVDAHNKHAIGSLKINGSVRSVTFSGDGMDLLASGSDGDIYRWDVNSRKCIERFPNYDGTVTASLATSNKMLAVGAESGVVNLYPHAKQNESKRRKPLKSVMNLQTSADCLRFNHDGQILAMSSRFSSNSLKLMHVPSRTVYSNWPTSKTPLKYVFSMDFSPQSRVLAIGNDKGKCLIYRLPHFG